MFLIFNLLLAGLGFAALLFVYVYALFWVPEFITVPPNSSDKKLVGWYYRVLSRLRPKTKIEGDNELFGGYLRACIVGIVLSLLCFVVLIFAAYPLLAFVPALLTFLFCVTFFTDMKYRKADRHLLRYAMVFEYIIIGLYTFVAPFPAFAFGDFYINMLIVAGLCLILFFSSIGMSDIRALAISLPGVILFGTMVYGKLMTILVVWILLAMLLSVASFTFSKRKGKKIVGDSEGRKTLTVPAVPIFFFCSIFCEFLVVAMLAS